MATVASNLMTAEEFFEHAHRPEDRDRVLELERGQVIELSRPVATFAGTRAGDQRFSVERSPRRLWQARQRKEHVLIGTLPLELPWSAAIPSRTGNPFER